MFKRRICTLAVALCVLRSSIAVVIPRQFNNFLDPNDDPFYAQPNNIRYWSAGQVIQSRVIPLSSSPLNSLQSATHIKYRSTDAQNRSVANVATLFTAPTPRSPPVILAYTFAEDSLNIACAPSYGFSSLRYFPGDRNTLLLSYQIIGWAMVNGIHVIMPDAEGPDSTWLVGLTEGRMTLDSIRAAMNYLKLDPKSTNVTLHGYSGAAHAAAWAGSIASTYAPEISIVGSAIGGTPVDLQSAYTNINSSYVAGLAAGALFGLTKGYPELQRSMATAKYGFSATGQAAYDDLTARDACIPSKNLHYVFQNTDSYFNSSPMDNPTFASVLKKETMLQFGNSIGSSVPTYPRMMYHSMFDEVCPFAPVQQYVNEQCTQPGANIIWAPTVIPEHVVTAVASIATITTFLGQCYDGTTPVCKCGDPLCIPPIVRDDALITKLVNQVGLHLVVTNGTSEFQAVTDAAGGEVIDLSKTVGAAAIGLGLRK